MSCSVRPTAGLGGEVAGFAACCGLLLIAAERQRPVRRPCEVASPMFEQEADEALVAATFAAAGGALSPGLGIPAAGARHPGRHPQPRAGEQHDDWASQAGLKVAVGAIFRRGPVWRPSICRRPFRRKDAAGMGHRAAGKRGWLRTRQAKRWPPTTTGRSCACLPRRPPLQPPRRLALRRSRHAAASSRQAEVRGAHLCARTPVESQSRVLSANLARSWPRPGARGGYP